MFKLPKTEYLINRGAESLGDGQNIVAYRIGPIFTVLDTSGNVVFTPPEGVSLVSYNPVNGMYTSRSKDNIECYNADGELMFIIK